MSPPCIWLLRKLIYAGWDGGDGDDGGRMVVAMMVNMKLVMLIRVGSEAMIGYSLPVLATDRATEEQPTALKGALIALDISKYSQY